MINWEKFSKARYFNGKNVTDTLDLTIKEVVEELVGIGADQEEKVVVYVVEDERGLVLNVNRSETLRDLFGNDTDTWKGGRFRLVPGRATFQGKAVRALFVEAAATPARRSAVRDPAPERALVDETPPPGDADWEVLNAE